MVLLGLETVELGPEKAFLDLYCCDLELTFSHLGEYLNEKSMGMPLFSPTLVCGILRNRVLELPSQGYLQV